MMRRQSSTANATDHEGVSDILLSRVEGIFGVLNDFIYEHVDVPREEKELVQEAMIRQRSLATRIPDEQRQEAERFRSSTTGTKDVRKATERDPAPPKRRSTGTASNRYKTLQQMRMDARTLTPSPTRRIDIHYKKIHANKTTPSDRRDRSRGRSRSREPPPVEEMGKKKKLSLSPSRKGGFFGWAKKKEPYEKPRQFEVKPRPEDTKTVRRRAMSTSNSSFEEMKPIPRGRSTNRTATQTEDKTTFRSKSTGRSKSRGRSGSNVEDRKVDSARGKSISGISVDNEKQDRGRSRSRTTTRPEDKTISRSKSAGRSKSRGRNGSRGRCQPQKGDHSKRKSVTRSCNDGKSVSEAWKEGTKALTPKNTHMIHNQTSSKERVAGVSKVMPDKNDIDPRRLSTHRTHEKKNVNHVSPPKSTSGQTTISTAIRQLSSSQYATAKSKATEKHLIEARKQQHSMIADFSESRRCSSWLSKADRKIDERKRESSTNRFVECNTKTAKNEIKEKQKEISCHQPQTTQRAAKTADDRACDMKAKRELSRPSPKVLTPKVVNDPPAKSPDSRRKPPAQLPDSARKQKMKMDVPQRPKQTEMRKPQLRQKIPDTGKVLIASRKGVELDEDGKKSPPRLSSQIDREDTSSPSQVRKKDTGRDIAIMAPSGEDQIEQRRGIFSIFRTKGMMDITTAAHDQTQAKRQATDTMNTRPKSMMNSQKKNSSDLHVKREKMSQLGKEIPQDMTKSQSKGDGKDPTFSPRNDKEVGHATRDASPKSALPFNEVTRTEIKSMNASGNGSEATTPQKLDPVESTSFMKVILDQVESRHQTIPDQNYADDNAENHEPSESCQVDKSVRRSANFTSDYPTNFNKIRGIKEPAGLSSEIKASPQPLEKVLQAKNKYSMEENSLLDSSIGGKSESRFARFFSKSFSRSEDPRAFSGTTNDPIHVPNTSVYKGKQQIKEFNRAEKSWDTGSFVSNDILSVGILDSNEEGHELVSSCTEFNSSEKKTINDSIRLVPREEPWMAYLEQAESDDLSLGHHDRYLVLKSGQLGISSVQ